MVLTPLFFPTASPTAGTLASFATYAAGFGARPIEAVIAGHLGDRLRRKAVLVGAPPTYAHADVLAPAALATLRVIQGLSEGTERGGAALLSVEHAPPGRRGLFGLTRALTGPEEFLAYGWRIPFLSSVVLVIVGLAARLRLSDSAVFPAGA
ncbi:MFS family permease [Mycobacteroides chelonae]|nr:MFS family permease [Mycobacteroides chelonae]